MGEAMSTREKIAERASSHLVRWYGEHLPRDVVVLRGSWFGRLFGAFGQSAVTINGTVHLTARAPDLGTDAGIAFLGHEIYHVLQQVQMGWWRYFVLYSLRWRPSHIREGWRHPMERPAYDRAREIREALA